MCHVKLENELLKEELDSQAQKKIEYDLFVIQSTFFKRFY